MPTPRQLARAETLARIKTIALRQLSAASASELSLRGIAREIDLVPSAIYRYFASRDALVTALIVDAYTEFAGAISAGSAAPRTPRTRWLGGATAMRQWAIAQPHRFSLLYGTPIPDYHAPAETIAPAGAVARAFLQPLSEAAPRQRTYTRRRALSAQLAAMDAALGLDISPEALLVATGAFARAIGMISMEIGGQFVGTFEPAEELYTALLARDADALGL